VCCALAACAGAACVPVALESAVCACMCVHSQDGLADSTRTQTISAECLKKRRCRQKAADVSVKKKANTEVGYTANRAALHCAALRCTALHCAALRCTALHCAALRCTALHCVFRDLVAAACRGGRVYSGRLCPTTTGGCSGSLRREET
jgi:hypothetical protein